MTFTSWVEEEYQGNREGRTREGDGSYRQSRKKFMKTESMSKTKCWLFGEPVTYISAKQATKN